MDKEDFGRNNPPFQRYIPSIYINGNEGLPGEDQDQSDTKQATDLITNIVNLALRSHETDPERSVLCFTKGGDF